MASGRSSSLPLLVSISFNEKRMAMNKHDKQHLRNLARIERMVEALFQAAATDAANLSSLVGELGEAAFSWNDYPLALAKINEIIDRLNSDVEAAIVNGVRSEWTLSNNKNNELCQRVFGSLAASLPASLARRYFSTNESARDAFLARSENGLNLSDNVWKYTNQFKSEIELALDVGIRSGRSADELSRDVREYLKNPHKLFRRVRDEHGQLQLSKNAAAYHPGRGVYRSSYMNARRLAATETNIAYRTADYLRWQQLDFVVGVEIHLSNNHNCKGIPAGAYYDICDELKGKYPKDFQFTGWHPHCRCYATSILKTDEELAADNERLLGGEEPQTDSVNRVRDVPQFFKDWLAKNDERIQTTSSVPYFMSDNPKYTGVQPRYGAIGAVTGTKLGRTATRAAFKEYDNTPAPTLTREVQQNTQNIASDFGIKTPPKPMQFIDADQGRANVSYGKSEEFSSNCQATVAVHEARLRGLNVTALGYNSAQGSVFYQLGEHFEAIWQHPKTGKIPTPTTLRASSFDGLLGKVEAQTKAVGRYHIGINMSENRGHVITAERLPNGKMMYYDAQNGVFLKLEEYAVSGVEYFEVLKVDKLLLRPDIFKQIARLL